MWVPAKLEMFDSCRVQSTASTAARLKGRQYNKRKASVQKICHL